MTRPPRDPELEAQLLARARGALAALQDYYTRVKLRTPEKTVHKAFVLLDFIKQVSR